MYKVGETPTGYKYKVLGYFSSYNEAYTSLLTREKNPRKTYTLADVYEEWFPTALEDNSWSRSTVYRTKETWEYISLKNNNIEKILPSEIRNDIMRDEIPKTVKKLVKSLYKRLFDYAIAESLCSTNPALNVTIPKSIEREIRENEKHKTSFSLEEIERISQVNSVTAKAVLYCIYSGWRPTELCCLLKSNVNLGMGFVIGGMKTKSGTNRLVPIHPYIRDIIVEQMATNGDKLFGFNYQKFLRDFISLMDSLGIEGASPHSCRKTFVTMAKPYLDEYAIKRIVGHKISDLTESVYTDRPTSWLIEEMKKLKILEAKKERQVI